MLQRLKSVVNKYWKILAGALFLLALIWAVLKGYSYPWTGFGNFTNPNGEITREKTLWDWMELLVIPLFLAGGAYYLNRSERENEREIAADHQREAALQSYLDRMAELLLKEKLKNPEEEVRDVARIRTLSALRSLDRNRKGFLLRFLQESGLIDRKEKSIVSLFEADLSDANLKNANLSGASLGGVNLRNANLEDSILRTTHLEQADLTSANLSNADLSISDSRSVNLTNANLSKAIMNDANFGGANLINANLHLASLYLTSLKSADLTGANLKDADLSGADFSYAKVSEKQLASAKSLKGATMPDGTKHK